VCYVWMMPSYYPSLREGFVHIKKQKVIRLNQNMDCIAAISTALGEGSIGVVRVSGQDTLKILEAVFRLPSGKGYKVDAQRAIQYGHVIHPQSGDIVDECIMLLMQGPRSFTGEDVVELQVHGGIRIVQQVLETVLLAGARLAEPGEFTKRAFLNGRIDLSQAEAVIDLIRSKTDLASRSALQQVSGRFSERIRGLRFQLIALQAHVEVTIDYPEHDVEAVACQQVIKVGIELRQQLKDLIEIGYVSNVLREGIVTAIVGRPNVGKSSLLNAMLKRDRAIVTDIPGTTRDVLEEYLNISGIPFRLADTAGIRETSDVVERIGVAKSKSYLEDAQLVVLVLSGSESLQIEDYALLQEIRGRAAIIVVNKSDLELKWSVEDLTFDDSTCVMQISAKEEKGITALQEQMVKTAVGKDLTDMDVTFMTTARQTKLLAAADEDILEAVQSAQLGATLDIIAVQLQAAYAALGHVIGEEAGEDLLDEIFSRFCLGK